MVNIIWKAASKKRGVSLTTFLNNARLETVSLNVTLKFKLRRSPPAKVFQLIYISNYRKGLVVPRSAFPWNCYLFQFEREYQSSRNPKKALIARQRYRMHDSRSDREIIDICLENGMSNVPFFSFSFRWLFVIQESMNGKTNARNFMN